MADKKRKKREEAPPFVLDDSKFEEWEAMLQKAFAEVPDDEPKEEK